MEEKLTFGKFITLKRKASNLTQRELSETLFVSESAISKWERGISYPDITLVSAICEALNITERELITASDDVYQRKLERQAERLQKISKLSSGFLWAIYGGILLICFICNLAIDQTLSWFFVVFAGVLIAFSLTTIPRLMHNNKFLWTLGSFFVSLNILFITCRLLYGGNWLSITMIATLLGFSILFLPMILKQIRMPSLLAKNKVIFYLAINTILTFALVSVVAIATDSTSLLLSKAYPVTMIGIIVPWTFAILIKYLKVNALYKVSICLFVSAVYSFLVNSSVNAIVNNDKFMLLKINFYEWNNPDYVNGNTTFILVMVFICIGSAFAIGGIMKDLRNK